MPYFTCASQLAEKHETILFARFFVLWDALNRLLKDRL